MSDETQPTWLVGKPGWHNAYSKSRLQATDRDAAALAGAQAKYNGRGPNGSTCVAVTHVGGGWYDVEYKHWSGETLTLERDFRVARAPDQSRRGLDEEAARAALAALFTPSWAVPEIGLRAGYDSGRADLALLPDVGASLGCEIKTARDSLDRLPRQVPLYEALFPRCLLAVTPRHLEAALKAVPEAWGMVLLNPDTHAVAEVSRAPVLRPDAPDPLAGAGLLSELWGEELLPLVQALGVRVTKAKRMQVGDRAHLLLEHHGVAACRAIALRVLSERKGRVRAVRHEG